MKLKRNCMFFNAIVEGSATADWGHELGQSQHNGYLMSVKGCSEIINGLVFNQVKDNDNFLYGRGGKKDNKEIEIISVFNNVKVIVYDVDEDVHNTHTVSKPFILIIAKETSVTTHPGRRTLKMNIGFLYNDIKNQDFYDEINTITSNPWFGYSLSYDNIDTGVLTITIIKAPQPEAIEKKPKLVYATSGERKVIWNRLADEYSIKYDSLNKVDEPYPTFETNSLNAKNIIYFGSPGTGKSHKVNEITNEKNVTQITFHPEYDYNSFVGGYKPTMNDKNEIEYSFVPQAFTNIYVNAWQNHASDEPTEHFYLQIEEINRGNCAEIFGDLFQLLDRDKNGYSKYSVDANKELNDHLKKEFRNHENKGLVDGKIRLPNNLTIIATMNTSDQSLFPMDSAFKRRWDWEYIRIDYNCDKSNFILKLNNENRYDWLLFLEAVNKFIFDTTGSPDKQIGNWFVNIIDINKIIDEKTFINKVLFYLWNDVFKDEDESLFDIDKKTRTYEDFFTNNEDSNLLVKMLEENLMLENISTHKVAEANEAE